MRIRKLENADSDTDSGNQRGKRGFGFRVSGLVVSMMARAFELFRIEISDRERERDRQRERERD